HAPDRRGRDASLPDVYRRVACAAISPRLSAGSSIGPLVVAQAANAVPVPAF
uniref:Uncharacterized protein n=1 Tax=Aegilops tauschii subsp. strangulata TaxID=200361 RepID=A0A453ERD8_AEGTS